MITFRKTCFVSWIILDCICLPWHWRVIFYKLKIGGTTRKFVITSTSCVYYYNSHNLIFMRDLIYIHYPYFQVVKCRCIFELYFFLIYSLRLLTFIYSFTRRYFEFLAKSAFRKQIQYLCFQIRLSWMGTKNLAA